MKKLISLFLILLSLTFIVGCNSGNKTVRFNPEKNEDETSTTVTPIEDEKELLSEIIEKVNDYSEKCADLDVFSKFFSGIRPADNRS